MIRPLVRAVLFSAVCLALPHVAAAQPARPAAASNVMLPQMPSISPDGQSVVFSWHGDLWRVAATGGTADRLTSNPAEETYSRFSPDGRTVAFNSDRRGAAGLYTMNADGTGVREVMAFDRPGFLSDYADGNLYFTGYVEPDVYRNPRPYSVPAGGGVFTRAFDAFGRNPVLEPDGRRILFTRGNFAWDRRHYLGADSRDVWLYTPGDPDPYKQLTTRRGNDGRARWAGKDKVIYTTDRADGTVNLFLMDLTGGADAEKNATRLTSFADRDVEEFDVTPDGKTAVFARWDSLYTLDLTKPNAEPKTLKIKAAEDERDAVKYVDIAGKADGGEAVAGRQDVRLRRLRPALRPRRGGRGQHAADRRGLAPPQADRVEPRRRDAVLHERPERQGRDLRGDGFADARRHPRGGGEAAGDARRPGRARGRPRHAAGDEARRRRRAAGRRDDGRDAGDDGAEQQAVAGRFRLRARPEQVGRRGGLPRRARQRRRGQRFRPRSLARRQAVARPDARPRPARRVGPRTGKETVAFDGWSNSIQYLWSPDSKHLIYSTEDANFNQDIWVTRADGTGYRGTGRPMNLTQHPDDDINMSLSADGRVLAFSSERVNEEYDVWSVYLDENLETLAPAELEEYYKSLAEKVKKAKPPAVPAFAKKRGTISPLAGRAASPATKGSPPATDSASPATNFSSPATNSSSPATSSSSPATSSSSPATSSPLPATNSPSPATDSTSPATKPSSPATLGVAGLRKALRDFILDESPRAGEAAKPKKDADEPAPSLDDFACETAYLRLRRVSRDAGNETDLLLSPDAGAIYYTSGKTLYKQPWKGERGEAGTAANLIEIAPDASTLTLLSGGKGVVQKLVQPGLNTRTTVGPEDRLEVDLAEQNELKFREMARTLGMLFYSPTMKDTDWPALTERYAPLARAARTPDEFEHVSMKLLGELNASHLGVTAPNDARPAARTFGRLGVRTEPVGGGGGGFKVLDVLETGPAGRGDMKLIPGDVVTKLELEPVKKNEAFDLQLADKAGREVVVTVERDGATLNLLLTPVAYAAISDLSYDAWRLDNLRKVEKLSDGRLGYIHVRAMDQASLDVFERDLYAAANGKEGLLVDVRNNGGGSTTDLLLASIMYPRHAYTVPRGMRQSNEKNRTSFETGGYPQDRLFIQRYNLPMDMLLQREEL